MLLKVYENGSVRLKADLDETCDLFAAAMVGIQHKKAAASRTHLESLLRLEVEILSMAEDVSDWWRKRKPDAAQSEFASDLRRTRDRTVDEIRRSTDS